MDAPADRSGDLRGGTSGGTVVYDADCGFCTRSAQWLQAHGTAEVQPWQSTDLAALGLTEDDVRAAAYWLDHGRVSARGAGAVAEALKTCRGPWRILGHLAYVRPVRPLADAVYGWVARNRNRLPGGTPACRWEPPVAPDDSEMTPR